MAGGWTRDGAVQGQIDASVDDGVAAARNQLRTGTSLTHFEDCEVSIPEPHCKAIPGVCRCVSCQAAHKKQQTNLSTFNRRGSKDSQLR